MDSLTDFYEKEFDKFEIGDVIKFDKEGQTVEGTLIYKSPYFITLQLPYYREAFSIPDFYMKRSRLAGWEIDPSEVFDENTEEEDEFEKDFDVDADV